MNIDPLEDVEQGNLQRLAADALQKAGSDAKQGLHAEEGNACQLRPMDFTF